MKAIIPCSAIIVSKEFHEFTGGFLVGGMMTYHMGVLADGIRKEIVQSRLKR